MLFEKWQCVLIRANGRRGWIEALASIQGRYCVNGLWYWAHELAPA